MFLTSFDLLHSISPAVGDISHSRSFFLLKEDAGTVAEVPKADAGLIEKPRHAWRPFRIYIVCVYFCYLVRQ